MATTRPKRLERIAEGLLVIAILGVTGATWLPALIGADPDPSAPVARERNAILQREQELRRTRGPRATPTVRPLPSPGAAAAPAAPPRVTDRPSPAPGVPADTPAP
jgi:hypothetical protein